MTITYIKEKRFPGKRNIPWDDIENYLKGYIGQEYIVAEYHDSIIIPSDFPDEYTGSKYTKSLRGAVAKAKANAVTEIGPIIENAFNRRFVENKNEKHSKDASGGWYRYDTIFAIPVQGEGEEGIRYNVYSGTLVVRRSAEGNTLYDIVNIKKEAR